MQRKKGFVAKRHKMTLQQTAEKEKRYENSMTAKTAIMSRGVRGDSLYATMAKTLPANGESVLSIDPSTCFAGGTGTLTYPVLPQFWPVICYKQKPNQEQLAV